MNFLEEFMFDRVPYDSLKPRQKENYNFVKIAAQFADYGFNCIRLSDDWQGADCIACHVDNETFLKVQLKGRLTLDKKYCKKDIFIAFISGNDCYVYPHDDFLNYFEVRGNLGKRGRTERWDKHGARSWPSPPRWAKEWLAAYRI